VGTEVKTAAETAAPPARTLQRGPAAAGAAAASPGPAWRRVPLLVLGFAALVAGTGAGLARLAWPMPAPVAGAAAWHGPLMICGFFGVVISLERAVAIGRRWAYAGPLLAGLGGVAALQSGAAAAPWLHLGAGAMLLAASLHVLGRQREAFHVVIALGAASWVAGTALWALGAAVHEVVGAWLAFLVLTIAGERLELSRFMPPARGARRLFNAIIAAVVVATAATLLLARPVSPVPPPEATWAASVAVRGLGAALVALAAWLLANDLARRTVRQAGLTRFVAVCLLSGYGWLAVGGAVMAVDGLAPGGAGYDAALHALLLGFVFAMVFGHAPIIFPAVLRLKLPYHGVFYAPLALLHASLALRLAGDALRAAEPASAAAFGLVRAGALASALALAAFVLVMASAAWRGRRRVHAARALETG
jgi:hypothetical protein